MTGVVFSTDFGEGLADDTANFVVTPELGHRANLEESIVQFGCSGNEACLRRTLHLIFASRLGYLPTQIVHYRTGKLIVILYASVP